MNETNQTKEMLLEIGKQCKDTRLFRNNTGRAYQSNQVVKNKDGSITLHNPRIIHAGLCLGSSDTIGWTSVVITPDMVGQRIAAFTAVESKTLKGVVSEEQQNFIEQVNKAGGIAGVARSPKEGVDVIKNSRTQNNEPQP